MYIHTKVREFKNTEMTVFENIAVPDRKIESRNQIPKSSDHIFRIIAITKKDCVRFTPMCKKVEGTREKQFRLHRQRP